MAKDKKKKRYSLKSLEVTEVSMVNRGANQLADVAIFKTAESKEELAKRSFDEVLAEMDLSDFYQSLCARSEKTSDALRNTFWEILYNDEIKDKKKAFKDAVVGFMSEMVSFIDDADLLDKLVKSCDIPSKDLPGIVAKVRGAWLASDPKRKEEDLPEAIKKTAEEIKMEKDLRYYQFLAKCSDGEKAFFKGLSEDEKEALFKADDSTETIIGKVQKSMEAEQEGVEKAKQEDESFDFNGKEIKKSDVGEALFMVLKSQEERANKLEKEAEELRDNLQKSDLEKEAEELWPNLPGDAKAKGALLKTTRALPEAEKEFQMSILKAANDGNAELFKENGHSNPDVDKSAEEELDELAKSHADKHKIGFHKAYDEVLQTAKGKELYGKIK